MQLPAHPAQQFPCMIPATTTNKWIRYTLRQQRNRKPRDARASESRPQLGFSAGHKPYYGAAIVVHGDKADSSLSGDIESVEALYEPPAQKRHELSAKGGDVAIRDTFQMLRSGAQGLRR